MDLDAILDDVIRNKIDVPVRRIDLSEHFYKGFFYKGMLWTPQEWKGEISIIKNIGFVDGLLKLEIENLTYPHSGYILLELETYKIKEVFNGDNYESAHAHF